MKRALLEGLLILVAVLVSLPALGEDPSWKNPSIGRAVEVADMAFTSSKDNLHFMVLTFSAYYEVAGSGDRRCKASINLRPVLLRLFEEAAERRRYYYPPYSREEIEDYLAINANKLVIELTMYSSDPSYLKNYTVIILQDSIVIRPLERSLPMPEPTDILDILLLGEGCDYIDYMWKVEGEVTFDLTELDALAPFQVKVIRRTLNELAFDVVDANSLGPRLLRAEPIPFVSPVFFVWPVEGEVVSAFGWRVHPILQTRHHHNGIDIAVPEGTIIYASASGEVNFVGEQQDHGMVLILDHPNNYHTVYGHLSEVLVHSGQSVEAGQPIAESGETGICSEPCLYFEVRNGELPLDPMRYLP